MPATVQLNTRIDPGLKARGDAVFARAGLTPSEAVCSMREYAARAQEVPECSHHARGCLLPCAAQNARSCPSRRTGCSGQLLRSRSMGVREEDDGDSGCGSPIACRMRSCLDAEEHPLRFRG
ncbi:hypothetical protein EII22_05400 [Coriobacteriales bacterium OH1046]|nr:hypothetical protein EII22_05400 [Coriobacteriales bacterium OH1046]